MKMRLETRFKDEDSRNFSEYIQVDGEEGFHQVDGDQVHEAEEVMESRAVDR